MVNGKIPPAIGLTLIAAVVIVLLALVALNAGGKAEDNIKDTLTGMNITYYNIAGMPMNYTVTKDSIGVIEKTIFENGTAWKVHIGEGMAWDLIMSEDGKRILEIRQLFYT